MVDHDAVATLQHLLDLARTGDLMGLSFAAIYRHGQYGYGYTRGAEQRPELMAGIIIRMTRDLMETTR